MRIAHFSAMVIVVLLGCRGQDPSIAPAFDPNHCFSRSKQNKQLVVDEFHSPEHFSSGSVLNCTVPLPMNGFQCYVEAATDVHGGFRWEMRGNYEVTNVYKASGNSVMWFACPKTKPCDAPVHDNLCGDWDHCCRVQADFGM